MTEYRGTMEVNFSVKAKNEHDARLEVLFIIDKLTTEDLFRNIIIQNIDPTSPDIAKWFFRNPDSFDEDDEE